MHAVIAPSRSRVRAGRKSQPSSTWTPPIIEERDLQWLVGRSVLSDFVQSHDFADVLRELAQNEYDAGGSRLDRWSRVQPGTTKKPWARSGPRFVVPV